jgi:hypothetical protein
MEKNLPRPDTTGRADSTRGGLISTTRSDRTTYAAATVIFGVANGGIFILARDLHSSWLRVLTYVVFFALVLGSQEWINRTAQTTPRYSRRRLTIGAATSIAIALGVVLPWLNWSEQSEPTSNGMRVLAIACVALPCWIAAAIIYRDPRDSIT